MSRELSLIELRLKRGAFKRQVTDFEKYLHEISNKELNDITLINLSKKLERLELKYTNFDDIQSEIELKAIDDDLEKEYDERTLLESRVDEIISIGQSHLKSKNNVSNSNETKKHSESHNVKLPTIELPSFDGNFTKWRSFKDTFTALIDDNNSLSDVQKLWYLKSSLNGEALNAIETLETTASNYQIALKIITDKFSNTRRIIYSHVYALLNAKWNNLKNFINNIEQNISCLNTFNIDTNSWDAILVPLFLSKLDKQQERDWEIHINSLINKNLIPTTKQLLQFLGDRADIYDKVNYNQNNQKYKTQSNVLTTTISNIANCIKCNRNHGLYQCKSFLEFNVQDRIKFIKSKNACLNCLKQGHFSNNCKASKCKTCHFNHNTLLHVGKRSTNNAINVNAKPFEPSNGDNIVNCVSAFAANNETLLATAEVLLTDNNGKRHTVRALLDPAATSNFITSKIVNNLNLEKHNYKFGISAFNQKSSTLDSCTTVNVASKHSNYAFNLPCIITPCITTNLPRTSFDITELKMPKNVNLADKDFNESREVDILINATMSWQLILDKTIPFGNNLKLHNTRLGWIVSGDMPLNHHETRKPLALTTISLDKQLENFWKVDEFKTEDKQYTNDDVQCENIFKRSTYRDESGRFVVSIPLKNDFQLGNSKQQAITRFFSLERKLSKQNVTKEMYINFMRDYEETGHMSKVKDSANDVQYFLPHHCVIRDESITTKLRVVFDGSCKTDSGLSLNDVQYTGPNIQNDLFSILINFRKHKYIATADIKQMYRQVLINKAQRPLQRIVWRDDPKNQLAVYELNTVTYGTASAPYLAVRCLKELADQNENKFPDESNTIRHEFYVDDLLTGADDIDLLNTRCENITKILATAGFHLHKWMSNTQLLKIKQCQPNKIIEINRHDATKTLGIAFEPSKDSFRYTFNKHLKLYKLTKREILRATAQIYDPLGILSPITITPKIIIQCAWKLKLDWDKELPPELQKMWNSFQDTLDEIDNISIPRHIITPGNILELHGFADASEKAYGACVYVKNMNNNSTQIHLVTAKSRVAPVKQITLPRLELCAAVLLAELYDRVKTILNIKFERVFMWSDSTITLAWINASPSKWKTFVGNRVAKIQELTEKTYWQHVSSRDNPADLISRGIEPRKLRNSGLWWHGPEWLTTNDYINKLDFSDIEIPERKTIEVALNTVVDTSIFTRYSNLNKLINVVAYCQRFINNCKNKTKNCGTLSEKERKESLTKLIRLAQEEEFHIEIKTLAKGMSLKTTSYILSLNPFVDDKGLLRVGGRLRHSNFSFNQKHQLILPKMHKLTILIASYEHRINLHCSQLHLLNILRQKYWPIAGKNLVKKVIHSCITCFKAKPRTYNEIMGDLPKLRVEPSPPFYNCGVDYAGPFYTRDRRARGYKSYKSYICLFVCFSTKAIHLELVSDISTEAFLASFRRFIARRGLPSTVHSDNGSNFVGAANELQKLYKFVEQNFQKFLTRLSDEGKPIKWNFIPPRSPHFGGLWESNVKLVKSHLTRVVGSNILTFEEFYTILTQIEAIINSRPLTSLSNDPNDLLPLTPSHFLIGRPLTTAPDEDLTDVSENRLSTFQRMQATVQHFWKRWKRDYIHQLQTRQKWKHSQDIQLKEGMLVLCVEENDPPYTWRMGRIVKLWYGKDNKVRVVTLKTTSGELKRAINKICVLPVDASAETSLKNQDPSRRPAC